MGKDRGWRNLRCFFSVATAKGSLGVELPQQRETRRVAVMASKHMDGVLRAEQTYRMRARIKRSILVPAATDVSLANANRAVSPSQNRNIDDIVGIPSSCLF